MVRDQEATAHKQENSTNHTLMCKKYEHQRQIKVVDKRLEIPTTKKCRSHAAL